MKANILRRFITLAIGVSTLILSAYGKDTAIYSGYKNLPWGSTIEYVKANYASALEACKDISEGTDISKGEYCLKQ